MSKYVIVKCPRCMSTIQLLAASITDEPFLCPVCSEGEVKSKAETGTIYEGDYEIPNTWKDLIIIYRAAR